MRLPFLMQPRNTPINFNEVLKMEDKKIIICIECKDQIARYWGSNLCEDCFREYLKEKVEDEK